MQTVLMCKRPAYSISLLRYCYTSITLSFSANFINAVSLNFFYCRNEPEPTSEQTPSPEPIPSPTIPTEKLSPVQPPSRLDGKQHWMARASKMEPCHMCGSTVIYLCRSCPDKPYLHPDVCFEIFHTRKLVGKILFTNQVGFDD